MGKDPYLSVIIPAYAEGELLGQVLSEIEHHLRQKNFCYEILVIVDGSPNNNGEIAKNHLNRTKNLIVLTMTSITEKVMRFAKDFFRQKERIDSLRMQTDQPQWNMPMNFCKNIRKDLMS